jgi:1-acyl-sn-glycerol-3-phosphate acyltransferase
MIVFRKILAAFRLLSFAVITLMATFFIYLGRLLGFGASWSFFFFKLAIKSIRFVLNIRANYHGAPPREPGLILSNHRSYIDIVLIPSKTPYVIVAKKEVSKWPVIGLAGKAIKVIFVDRDSTENRKLVRTQIISRLKEGLSVLIYPEGTTFEGPGILRLKPGMFRVAAHEGLKIYPVAIEFKEKDMAWIGDDTFIPHFFKAFSRWRVDVDVSFGPAISGSDEKIIRDKTFDWIDSETRRLAGQP